MKTTTEDNARVAERLVDAFASLGVEHAVVSPGSRNTPLVLALAAASGFQIDVVVDERAAGFIALGQALASGRPSLLVCTSGSAGAHYLPAVLEAENARVPMLVLTADRPPELHHCGANQTTVQTDLFGGHVRWSANLGPPSSHTTDRWLSHIAARAYRAALGSPAGPVQLNVPFREPLWDGSQLSERAGIGSPAVLLGRGQLTEEDLLEVAERLSRADSGLVVVGPNRFDRAEHDALTQFAKRLGWPVLADPASGLRGDSAKHPNILTSYDLFLATPNNIPRPDAIVRVGRPLTSKIAERWLASLDLDTVVLVDEEGLWGEPSLEPSHFVQASVSSFFRGILAQVGDSVRSDRDPVLGIWLALESRTLAVTSDHLEASDWEGAVARRLADTLPPGSLFFVGNSMPIRDLDAFSGPSLRGVTAVSNRGVSGIDGAISSLLGASTVWKRGPVVGCIGDLTFLHDLDGLAAAASLDTRAALVVINNGGGGIFSFLPIARHRSAFEPYYQTKPTHDVGSLCAAVGVEHKRIEGATELGGALQSLLERPGLSVLEVVIDRDRNIQRHHAVRQAVEAAISQGAREHVS